MYNSQTFDHDDKQANGLSAYERLIHKYPWFEAHPVSGHVTASNFLRYIVESDDHPDHTMIRVVFTQDDMENGELIVAHDKTFGDRFFTNYERRQWRINQTAMMIAGNSQKYGPKTASPPEPRCKCQFCLGAKGGVPGNENRFGNVIVCDYCTALLLEVRPPSMSVDGAVSQITPPAHVNEEETGPVFDRAKKSPSTKH